MNSDTPRESLMAATTNTSVEAKPVAHQAQSPRPRAARRERRLEPPTSVCEFGMPEHDGEERRAPDELAQAAERVERAESPAVDCDRQPGRRAWPATPRGARTVRAEHRAQHVERSGEARRAEEHPGHDDAHERRQHRERRGPPRVDCARSWPSQRDRDIAPAVIDHEQRAVHAAPDDECPARAVPQPAQQHRDEQVHVAPDRALSGCRPGGRRDSRAGSATASCASAARTR